MCCVRSDTKFSDNTSSEIYNVIQLVTPEIIIGKYNLFTGNEQLIKEDVYFNKNGETNFPKSEHYKVRTLDWSELAPTSVNIKGELVEYSKLSNNTPEKQNWIETYLKKGVVMEEEMLYLINKKETEYFVIKFEKGAFLVYSLTKTPLRFGRIGTPLFKEKLVYKLIKRE